MQAASQPSNVHSQIFKVLLTMPHFTFGGRIQKLIEGAGCQLKYLPSCSPDLNKIERCWSWLKSRICQILVQFNCIRDATEDVLCTAS